MSHLWLTLNYSRRFSITAWQEAADALPLRQSTCPIFIVLVGRRAKAQILRHLVDSKDAARLQHVGHGQVSLWADRSSSKSREPIVYVDNEAQRAVANPNPCQTASGQHVEYLLTDADSFTQQTRRHVANMLCGQVLAPLSDVLCYFAADLGGVAAVAVLLADQVLKVSRPCDLPSRMSPCVVVVVETVSKIFDSRQTEVRLMRQMRAVLEEKGLTPVQAEGRIQDHFREIGVLGLSRNERTEDKASRVRKRLLSAQHQIGVEKTVYGMRFSRDHSFAIAHSLLTAFSRPRVPSPSLVASTRAVGFDDSELAAHIQELFDRLPQQSWLFSVAVPLLSSAIILESYPPGAHAFPIRHVYDHVYAQHVTTAIKQHVVQVATRESMHRAISKQLEADHFDLLKRWDMRSSVLHARRLQELRYMLKDVKTHRTCLCCLARGADKVLLCGHSLCDICIRIYGRPAADRMHSFNMDLCILCGQQGSTTCFNLLPPTAGVRLLSLDGGGIKSIIQLAIIEHIEDRLRAWKLPFRDFFDFACGTSAGGLVAVGLFMMQWTVKQSIEKFEHLANKTFERPGKDTHWFDRMQYYIVSFLRDCQYSPSTIQESFKDEFGQDIRMFNPLRTDTKVAVTSTIAKESTPCIFANYNGKLRPSSADYDLVRASSPSREAFVSDVVCCTSAAPWYFKSFNLSSLSYQDGGLHHNCPIFLVRSEARFVWPDRPIDLCLSLGTGTSADVPATPSTRERFFSRLWRAFMKSMDCERMYRTFVSLLDEREASRHHRLNPSVSGAEPMLDDYASMAKLKHEAQVYVAKASQLDVICDTMVASMFYLELDALPTYSGGSYACSATIKCRMELSSDGRRAMWMSLRGSYFLINGNPVSCVDQVPDCTPSYRKSISFEVESMQDSIGITLRGITTAHTTISGLPKTVGSLVALQSLHRPFGTIDHLGPEKRLPHPPGTARCSSVYSR